MLPMPSAAMSRHRPAKSPSLIRWRCGQVWLPIGRPNGFICISRAKVGRNAAAAEVAADCLRNSRLEISSISHLSVRQRPSVAIVAAEILIRVARVGELHGLRVPEQRGRAAIRAE